jgi:hypothetical protein
MARQSTYTHKEKKKIKRPGVHSKTKTSSLISSKYYRKLYRGQGR